MPSKGKKQTKKRKAGETKLAVPATGDLSVTVKRAANGYVVSRWSSRAGRDITYIATNKAEAGELLDKLLRKR